MKLIFTKQKILEWLYITIGVAISSFAFSFFLNPRNIVIGGVSGIGVIIKGVFGTDPALVILLINFALVLFGLLTIGKDFFIKTVYGSLMFPIFIKLFDYIYIKASVDASIQNLDMVLITLFSSLIMGAGLGIVVKHGGTTGGTEIPQKILFKYLHIPFSMSLYFLDGAVILTGLFVTGDLSITLYAIIFTYLSGFVMDTVIFSGFNKRAVYIISSKNEEIKHELLVNFERGVTGIKVVGEYSKSEKKMLVCVLSTIEYYKLREIIEHYDKTAFYYAVRASEVRGEGFSYDIE